MKIYFGPNSKSLIWNSINNSKNVYLQKEQIDKNNIIRKKKIENFYDIEEKKNIYNIDEFYNYINNLNVDLSDLNENTINENIYTKNIDIDIDIDMNIGIYEKRNSLEKNIENYYNLTINKYNFEDYTDEYMQECMNQCGHEYMDEYMDEYIDEYMDEYIDEYESSDEYSI